MVRRNHWPPCGALPDGATGVRGGTEGCPCASPRSRGSTRSTRPKGTVRHVAAARDGGRILDGRRAAARENRVAGPHGSGVRTESDRPWREVSRPTEVRSDAVPAPGQRRETGSAEWLAGQMSKDTPGLPRATARECASTGGTAKAGSGWTGAHDSGSPVATQRFDLVSRPPGRSLVRLTNAPRDRRACLKCFVRLLAAAVSWKAGRHSPWWSRTGRPHRDRGGNSRTRRLSCAATACAGWWRRSALSRRRVKGR